MLKDIPKKELEEVVKNSRCLNDVIRALGYSTVSGANFRTVKKRIEELGISTEHFTISHSYPPINDEEVFCQNSKVSSHTLRKRYKKRFAPEKCDVCGMLPVWNGKPITLILDHKNGDNKDNRIDNLHWVCPNCNSQLSTTGFKGIIKYDSYGNKLDESIKIKSIHRCHDCGRVISSDSKRCTSCLEKRAIISSEELLHKKSYLEELLLTKSMVEIGNIYEVSDNAIRKWCKKLGLPYKHNQIKQYREEHKGH